MEPFIRWQVEGDVVDCHYWWLSTAGAFSIHHTLHIAASFYGFFLTWGICFVAP